MREEWRTRRDILAELADAHERIATLQACLDERTAEMVELSKRCERLTAAVEAFVAWLDREEAGGEGQPWREMRGTPEGDASWREWYSENLRLCDLAQTLGRAALEQP